MKKKDLSVIILTKNEAKRIEKCIQSVGFADEVIVVDDESHDQTVQIAQKNGAQVIVQKRKSFAKQRNQGLEKARGDWVLYVDADETVSAELTQEIKSVISKKGRHAAYKIPRKNSYLGKPWPHIERLERLFFKKNLVRWTGAVHESPIVDGTVGTLQYTLLHDTHRSLSEMVDKTRQWSMIEARLRHRAGHPPVTWWRFPRVMGGAFWQYYIRQGGWRVGTVGIIESMYQALSIFVTYAQLWELQQRKS